MAKFILPLLLLALFLWSVHLRVEDDLAGNTMLNQRLSLKQQQRLSQQQIQQIKLLEIPALEMEERILQEVDDNPALELGEDPEREQEASEINREELSEEPTSGEDSSDDFSEMEEYLSEEDAYENSRNEYDKNSEDKREFFSGVQVASLHDLLMQQLEVLSISEEQRLMGEYIIGNMDDDGYLRVSLTTISDQIAFQTEYDVTESQLETVWEMIRAFEPAGVAAKDLKDCLLLQLQRKPQTESVNEAQYLLEHYFEDFSRRRYDAIRQHWGISSERFDTIVHEIVKLNPKPGNALDATLLNETGRQITPDFILENHDGALVLSLNDNNIPEMHVSPVYIRILKDYTARKGKSNKVNREAAQFARQKVESAQWFINAIRQRQQTLISTMQAIVNYQREFFLSGDEKTLRPMILKDIAGVTGLDISTVSRVSSSKYIQTEFGMYSLKYFFSESLQTDTGEEVSVIRVKHTLQELVDAEDKKQPYTDEQLVVLLKEHGFLLARRTVAKYREQLAIPIARMRIE